jgi:hypothetical protein
MEKNTKQQEIEGKLTAWRKLSPADQLADLDRRLGKGIGATKQRARIQAKLNKQVTKVVDTTATSTESTERPQRPKRQKNDK